MKDSLYKFGDASMEGEEKALLLFIFGLGILLALNFETALTASDEVTYMLMAKNFAEGNGFEIKNGMGDVMSVEYMVGTSNIFGEGDDAKIVGLYPQLYTILSYPFYIVLSVEGLVLMNILAFLGTVYLVFIIGRDAFDGRVGFLGVAIFTFCTYASSYAVAVWPHSLSMFLVAVSAYFGLSVGRFQGASFACGIIAGVAVGVRYQNLIYAFILFAWMLLEHRGKVGRFIVGMSLPVAGLAGINNLMFGDVLMTGYGNRDMFGLLKPVVLVPGVAAAVLAYLILRTGAHRRIVRDRRMLTGAALTLLVVGLFFDFSRVALLTFCADVFDLTMFPGNQEVGLKKALLQSTPVFVLALMSPLLKVGKYREKVLFLFGLAAVAPVFFAFMPNHGGEGDALNMRYFIESLPFLSVLTAYSIIELAAEHIRANRKNITVAVLVLAAVLWPFVSNNGYYMSDWFYRPVPVITSVVLAAAAIARSHRVWGAEAFTWVLVFALSYSVVTSSADFIVKKNTQDLLEGVAENVGAGVGNYSVVIYYHRRNSNVLAPLKLGKDVVLLDCERDDCKSAEYLAGQHIKEGRSVYVFSYRHETIPELDATANRLTMEHGMGKVITIKAAIT
ncbi:MAG: hypothetical protein GF416_09115 [Candidatus Altiarchaeales archaeon]|nr:hypothetical protein [Candidatus Altiarchaeales archaeon]MBD3417278.1 hypothetical protein [Candidatus Altiarchaeales archaeon]